VGRDLLSKKQNKDKNHEQPKDATEAVEVTKNVSFPIVGIGASAGGLEALKSLLGKLSSETAWLL
jgi:chemotaxis response regulator CheB